MTDYIKREALEQYSDNEIELDELEGEIITDSQLHDLFDDWLDEVYGDASIAGMDYITSRAFKEIDEIAYDTSFNDWSDSQEYDEVPQRILDLLQ